MQLGALAGGIAKGYTAGEELKQRKAQRDLTEQETRRRKRENDTEDAQAAMAGAIRMPGQTTTDDYNPDEALQKAMPAPAPPQQRAGLIGALGRFLKPDEAAVAAGVTPPPGGALPVPPRADTAPGAPADPNEVVVEPPKKVQRPVTEADTRQDYWRSLVLSKAPVKDQLEAFKAFHEADTKQNVGLLMTASPAQMSNILNKHGMDITVLPDESGKGFVVVDSAGNETKYPDREKLSMALTSALEADPAQAVKANMAFRAEDRDNLRLNLEAQRTAATLKHAAAQTALAYRESARQDAAEGRAQGEYDRKLQDVDQFKAAVDVASNPDNAFLMPDEYKASAGTLTRLAPSLAKGYAKDGDASYPVNLFVDQGQRQTQRIMSSPYVTQGIIGKATSGGRPVFMVKDKDGTPGGYASFDEAEAAARKIYGKLDGKKH